MKKLIGIMCIAAITSARVADAAGYTAWAVPTSVENVNGGTLISGTFGDPNNCGVANYIFVNQSATNYKEVVSMAYMAIAARKEMQIYASSCTQVGFHWAGNVINLSVEGQGVAVR